mmetsp:Transcript_3856/g.8493  ORF Transcript_3856/g.8493 Transcript_3856/m.8493 type:complete len:93 (+) Transcript_3856:348-626(+)|eukprot:CAMPEP_0180116116 /NCGR_PEP_ID=MMETSP0986-20121125/183_1 /TAXON_ID=697907 /ORGANISM="non described non described, Strain CCMP2293" /LENGTH=92 /DNA_ID=CAMNT_0022054841 /DNA_START=440 /DNA_END=718 /DNA_ORIENTATION=+
MRPSEILETCCGRSVLSVLTRARARWIALLLTPTAGGASGAGSARGLADTPPEWAGNSGSSFTVNNTSRETQGDDEWVQELYDMQGMVGEES